MNDEQEKTLRGYMQHMRHGRHTCKPVQAVCEGCSEDQRMFGRLVSALRPLMEPWRVQLVGKQVHLYGQQGERIIVEHFDFKDARELANKVAALLNAESSR